MAETNVRIVAARKGPPSVLRAVEEPIPGPRAGEILIRVRAAGVAWADVMMREGVYPGTTFPLTPGYDVVGIVEAAGTGVNAPAVGDVVAALTVRGGYSRFIVLPASEAVPLPAGLDDAEAVSLVLNYVTAYQLIHRCGNAGAGDTVLVHGAAGGVGTALLQLCALAGIRTIGTASAGKHDVLRRYDCEPIDYRSEDVVKRVRELSDGGVHAAFDAVGGAHVAHSYAALRPGGTVVSYGASTVLDGGRLSIVKAVEFLARSPRYTPSKLLADSKSVAGYNITVRKSGRPGDFAADLSALFSLLAGKKVAPLVAERIPLAEASRAHDLLGAAQIAGKLVLV